MLDEEEREHWVRSGHAMFGEFMARVEKIDRIGVKGMNESTEEKRVTLIDKRKVYGTLEEIADLYVSDEKKLVLDFTESKALAVFQSPSPQHPMEYIGFRWSYYKTPSRLVCSQDFFYLETMKPFVDVYGRRGWAKCSHSIEHPMCPDNSSSRSVNRGRLYYSGVVFVESREKGVLETTFYYSIDTTSIPAFLLPIVMKARGKNNAALINHYVKLARVTAYAEKTNANKLKQQLVDEKRCGACSNRMPKWSSKAKCYFCKSYVCKRCCEIVSKNYLFDGEDKCNSCMLCAESHGTKITSLMEDDDSAVSSTTDDAESRVEDVQTPSSVESFNAYASTSSQSSNARLERCMSMPMTTHRVPLPPKLIDLGIEDMDLRKHDTASYASPPAPSATQPPMSPIQTGRKPSQSTAIRYDRIHQHQQIPVPRHEYRERDSGDRRAPFRRHIEREGGAAITQATASTQPRSQRRRPYSHSEDEPARIRQSKEVAYTRENPCDLSYLSAFKV